MIGKKLAQAYLDDPRHTAAGDPDGRIQPRWIMDDHFQRAHDEGVALARDAFLNMIADARRFEEDVDGDEVNGRTVITCDYHFTVEESSLAELAEALGIRRGIMSMESIGDVILREVNADIEANAAQGTPTRQRQDRNGLGPKDGGPVGNADAPETDSPPSVSGSAKPSQAHQGENP